MGQRAKIKFSHEFTFDGQFEELSRERTRFPRLRINYCGNKKRDICESKTNALSIETLCEHD